MKLELFLRKLIGFGKIPSQIEPFIMVEWRPLWLQFSHSNPANKSLSSQPVISINQTLSTYRQLKMFDITIDGERVIFSRAKAIRYPNGKILSMKVDYGWIWTIVPWPRGAGVYIGDKKVM